MAIRRHAEIYRETYRGEIQNFAGGEGESDIAGDEGESDVAGGETQFDVAGGEGVSDGVTGASSAISTSET